ncbi:glycosyltransferase family 49 protein [Backusella circina FSU 941]|nr:glycosyltransferase family 49 protein [Backusella circina FSU 941]
MSDNGLPTGRPKHSRSTSVTISTKTTSHQRKPSFNFQKSLPEQTNPQATQQATAAKRNSISQQHQQQSGLLFNSFYSRLHSFLNPTAPLLPRVKNANAFGGSRQSGVLSLVLQSKLIRFLALFYIIFSVFLSLNHTWKYLFHSKSTKQADVVVYDDFVPHRTYDADETYSLMDTMTHGVKMHKLFSKSYYEAANGVQPFWLQAREAPAEDQVSIITTATAETWDEFKKLTEYWEGPISVIVHVDQNDQDTITKIQQEYDTIPELFNKVDVHLAKIPNGGKLSVLFPRNAERNLARLLARTEFIMDLPYGRIPASALANTLESNKEAIVSLLRSGDLLVLPTFAYKHDDEVDVTDLPFDKSRVLELIHEDVIYLSDNHWKENEGPTDLDRWTYASSLYAVEKYEFHYEPVVIESKTVQPWCSERFLDSRAACIFSSYLMGNEIWVLPDDYVVQLPNEEEHDVSDFDKVVENRIYAKFYWEQCVHHARQLDALGLWKSPRSRHVRNQCSRVIQNWGKGIIGKPE